MPQAAQIVDSFHCGAAPEREVRREARVRLEAPAARGDEVPVAEEEGVAYKAPALEEGGARFTQLHIGQKLVISVTNK